MSTLEELYAKEKRLLERKGLGLNLKWTEIHAMIQVRSQHLAATEADQAYNKLSQVFQQKPGVAAHLSTLLKKVSVKSGTVLVICITTLRQLFADELGDWGGGGRKLKNDPLSEAMSTTMRRR